MEYVRLGKSNLMISRVAMGAMSLTKIGDDEVATELLRNAFERGINFFDTSRSSNVSEKILGNAFTEDRSNIVIATKTHAQSVDELLSDLESSLNAMHVDCVDLYQYETDSFLPQKDGTDGIYNALLQQKKLGRVKAIGIATEDFDVAKNAVASSLYDTLQFPFSMISPEETISLVKLCEENDVGFIAMQPLCGGVVENIPLAVGFLQQYENVIPIWGVQSIAELDQILYFNDHPPLIDEQFLKDVEKARMFFN